MKKRVVITGLGVNCGKAANYQQFAGACLRGESLLVPCDAFSTEGLATAYFGEAEGLQGDRTAALLTRAAEELLASAGLTAAAISAWGSRCRLLLGSLIFPMDYFQQQVEAKLRGAKSDALTHSYDFIGLSRRLLGVRGGAELVSSACASGTTAVGMGLDYLRAGVCDCAVVGGFDPLAWLTACGFNALHNMSSHLCRPFDEQRDGLNIGEGAALFLLETEEHAKKRGAKLICEVAGAALSNDAYHLTSPDPEGWGAEAVMRGAIADAGLEPSQIDYINAHGTGTRVNDAMEQQVMERIFGKIGRPVYYSSTKGSTGHCMGAAGAIEIAACIAAIEQQQYLPMPHLQQPLGRAESDLKLSAAPLPLKIEAVLSNSFAFSGHNAAVVLQRV